MKKTIKILEIICCSFLIITCFSSLRSCENSNSFQEARMGIEFSGNISFDIEISKDRSSILVTMVNNSDETLYITPPPFSVNKWLDGKWQKKPALGNSNAELYILKPGESLTDSFGVTQYVGKLRVGTYRIVCSFRTESSDTAIRYVTHVFEVN